MSNNSYRTLDTSGFSDIVAGQKIRGMPSPTDMAFNLSFVGPKTTPAEYGTWDKLLSGIGDNWQSILGGLGLAGGAATLFGYGGADLDWDPTLTEQEARDMIRSSGAKAFDQIGTAGQMAKKRALSNYAGLGLGSGGQVVGDIADVEVGMGKARGEVEASLNQQLMDVLRYIEQRDLQVAQMEQAQEKDMWSQIGDLLMVGGMVLL